MKNDRPQAQTQPVDCVKCGKPIAPTAVKKYDNAGNGPMHEGCFVPNDQQPSQQ